MHRLVPKPRPRPPPPHPDIRAHVPALRTAGDVEGAEFHALVDRLHGQYVKALRALFEAHRERFAKGESDLDIVE